MLGIEGSCFCSAGDRYNAGERGHWRATDTYTKRQVGKEVNKMAYYGGWGHTYRRAKPAMWAFRALVTGNWRLFARIVISQLVQLLLPF